jgi:hypothetical protein
MFDKHITDISEKLFAACLGQFKRNYCEDGSCKYLSEMWLTSPSDTTSYPGRLKSS